MAEKESWLTDSMCPVVPASGYYAVDILNTPQIGVILKPRSSTPIMPGGVGIVRICAVAPPEDRIDEPGYKTSGLYKPGDVVYALMSLDMKGEKIEWTDPKTRERRAFYLISEGRIMGRHRWPEAVIASHEEQLNAE